MDARLLRKQVDWLTENAPYKRSIELVQIGESGRVYGLMHELWASFSKNMYARRARTCSPLSVGVEEVLGIDYSSYITTDEFHELLIKLKSNASLVGVSTYDSVDNVIMKLLVDNYENDITLDVEYKKLFATLYRGAKYFGELFIITEKPDWWGE
jgi:hypothetical protein